MKAPLCMLISSFALVVALAQTTPPTNPHANTQPDDKKGSPIAPASTTPAEMKTTTFKGVLVDMSCASRTSASAETTPAAGGAKPSEEPKAPASDQSNSANRSTSDSG